MNKKALIIIGIVLAVLVVLVGLYYIGKKETNSDPNKLICTKTTKEDGFEMNEKFEITFNENETKANITITMDFESELTDELYNSMVEQLGLKEDGTSSFGTNTKVSRESKKIVVTSEKTSKAEGNSKEEMKTRMEENGYKCK